jgi:hypothetical protein
LELFRGRAFFTCVSGWRASPWQRGGVAMLFFAELGLIAGEDAANDLPDLADK